MARLRAAHGCHAMERPPAPPATPVAHRVVQAARAPRREDGHAPARLVPRIRVVATMTALESECDRILAFLCQHPGRQVREIADGSDVEYYRTYRVLYRLEREGRVHFQIDLARRKRWFASPRAKLSPEAQAAVPEIVSLLEAEARGQGTPVRRGLRSAIAILHEAARGDGTAKER